jgi:NTE family protein
MKHPEGKTPKVGLALSGGTARAMAHIGVLKALEDASIPIDMISGTSAGALSGACYAKERNAAILEEMMLGLDWRKLVGLFDLNLILLWKGFVQGQRVKSLLSSIIGNVRFEDLEIPLSVVATDIRSMEEIVINEGSVAKAVRASISVPMVFTPVKWRGRFLIDGGAVNPLPVDVVRKMGAEVVIAVNTAGISQRRKRRSRAIKEVRDEPIPYPESTRLSIVKRRLNSLIRRNDGRLRIFNALSNAARARIYTGSGKIDPRTPNMFEVLMQLINAMQYEKIRLATKSADIVIAPDVSSIGMFAFHKADEAIDQGYKATKKILPELRELIHCP